MSFPFPSPSALNPRLITPYLTHYHLLLCLPLSPSFQPPALNPRLIIPPLTHYHLLLCLPLSPSPHPQSPPHPIPICCIDVEPLFFLSQSNPCDWSPLPHTLKCPVYPAMFPSSESDVAHSLPKPAAPALRFPLTKKMSSPYPTT